MKIKNLILLTCVLNMPIQPAFSEIAKGFVPASASKTTVTTPRKVPTISSGRTLKGPVSIAGPGGTAVSYSKPTVVQRGRAIVKMGVNLKLLSLKWDDEICAQACPQLRNYDLGIPTCDLAFRVTNTGDVASGAFSASILRTLYTGNQFSTQINSGGYTLAPHETKTFKISRDTLGLYKLGRPFTLTLDPLNRIAETNENDNSATFLPPR